MNTTTIVMAAVMENHPNTLVDYQKDMGREPPAEWPTDLEFSRTPFPSAVLCHPETATVPAHPILVWRLCLALGRVVSTETADSLFIYLLRDELPFEFAVVAAKEAVRRNLRFIQCPAGHKWMMKYSRLIQTA